MTDTTAPIGNDDHPGTWLADPVHRAWLAGDAAAQLAFFRNSLRGDGGFDVLDYGGRPLARGAQELHTTTRLVHSFALARQWGLDACDRIIDAGMAFLVKRHRDPVHGGYLWSVGDAGGDGTKLAYGHVFVLLAAASARQVGHPDANWLAADVMEVIDRRFWDDAAGRLRDEFARDWSPISTYRGFNANMHGIEAFLAAHEATGDAGCLDRAGRMLRFFAGEIAPRHGWRLPEHYTERWEPDLDYAGNPMFRPRGTTPGHSFELARLLIQHWDLCGRTDASAPEGARRLVETALRDAWLPDGGLAYTLDHGGRVAVADRYWWPVTEAIGAIAALLKTDFRAADEAWYRTLWRFARDRFVDCERGGWFPEIDAAGHPDDRQFRGKPDLYHALQADLFPLSARVSRLPDPPEATPRR
jgi:mannose/cellobiose epimerase-like protein (N-acyl-D-glucosamine 2-epimerase family)